MAGYAIRARPWCSGNTRAFQALVTGSSPVGRSPGRRGAHLRALELVHVSSPGAEAALQQTVAKSDGAGNPLGSELPGWWDRARRARCLATRELVDPLGRAGEGVLGEEVRRRVADLVRRAVELVRA